MTTSSSSGNLVQASTAGAQPVDLAPGHKRGLLLSNPVLLAAGIVGYGDAVAPGLDLDQLGGFVTAPITRRAWRRRPPQVIEVPGGILWRRGPWNPGVRRVIRDHAATWKRSFAAVIAHVAGDDPDDIAAVAGVLEDLPGVSGLELDVPGGPRHDPDRAADLIWAAREAADLPVLARLPLAAPDALVQAVLSAGADALVIAQPPPGVSVLEQAGERFLGGLHGPGLVSLVAARLGELATWVEVPLVACGGVHEPAHALTYLAAGGSAVQVDTAAWVDPRLPGRVAQALSD